jgi:hypothetical protein
MAPEPFDLFEKWNLICPTPRAKPLNPFLRNHQPERVTLFRPANYRNLFTARAVRLEFDFGHFRSIQ